MEPQPQAEVVEVLEGWLDMAKRGELRTIALAGARPTGHIRQHLIPEGENLPVTSHAVAMLHRDVLDAADDDEG